MTPIEQDIDLITRALESATDTLRSISQNPARADEHAAAWADEYDWSEISDALAALKAGASSGDLRAERGCEVSKPINDGGPAFPTTGVNAVDHEGRALNPWAGHGWAQEPHSGMSQRAYLAAKFAAAEIGTFGESDYSRYQIAIAERAAKMADTLLGVLSRPQEGDTDVR